MHKIIGVKVHSRRSCCCYTNTMVQFDVTSDAHEQHQGGRGLFGSLFGGNPSVGTLNIEVPGSADTAPLFDYVYGVLGRSGHGAQMHSLAHMIGSGLVVSLDRRYAAVAVAACSLLPAPATAVAPLTRKTGKGHDLVRPGEPGNEPRVGNKRPAAVLLSWVEGRFVAPRGEGLPLNH